MMLRGSLVFALVAVTSATGNLGNLKNLVKNARRLQGAATMQDCMTACPMPEMGEDDIDFNGLCKAMDCMMKEDKCGGEGGMVEMMATSTDGMLDCVCDPSMIDHVVGLMGAGKAGGECENEEKKEDGETDPCKMTPGSACVAVMAGAINALKGVTACEGMVKTMEKDWTAEEKICVDDLLAAAPASGCDMGKVSPVAQEAMMEMASAGSDCDKLEKANKKLQDGIKDGKCEEEFKDQPAMKTLKDALDAAGCDTSGAKRTLATISLPFLGALAFFGQH